MWVLPVKSSEMWVLHVRSSEMWILHLSSSEMVTPSIFLKKYFPAQYLANTEGPNIRYIYHIFTHCSRLTGQEDPSYWRTGSSDSGLTARHIAVSSAYILTLDLTCSGRSLMYVGKRTGPRANGPTVCLRLGQC